MGKTYKTNKSMWSLLQAEIYKSKKYANKMITEGKIEIGKKIAV